MSMSSNFMMCIIGALSFSMLLIILFQYISFSNNVSEGNSYINEKMLNTLRVIKTPSSPRPSDPSDPSDPLPDLSWTPFNSSNPFQTSWCPNATCQNSPLCTPCNRRHLFILSTARSGSTTLLRMMNDLPNTRLSGENHNTFGLLSQIESNLLNNRPRLLKHPMDKPNGPFRHNTIPKGSLGCISQQLHYTMNPPPLEIQQNIKYSMNDLQSTYDMDRILGFKSVRLHKFESPKDAVRYFKTHFPCSRFIVNIQQNITHQYESYIKNFDGTKKSKKKRRKMQKKRLMNMIDMENQTDDNSDVDADATNTTTIATNTISSNFNSNNTINVSYDPPQNITYKGPNMKELEEIRNFHIQVGELFGTTYAKVIKLEDWKDNVTVLNEVIHWMGFDSQKCAFNTITHDNANGYSVDNSTIDLGEDCNIL